MKKEIQIPQERDVGFFMIKMPGHASSFSGVDQSHYSPSEITQDLIEKQYFKGTNNDGDNSVNKYFYESSNENVAFKGTIIDWIDYTEELTGQSIVD